MEYIEELQSLLDKSIKNCCAEDRVGIILSAGIDSTILAIMAQKYSKVIGYSVGLAGSPDLYYTKKLQKDVYFDINLVEITKEDIEENIDNILNILFPLIKESIKSISAPTITANPIFIQYTYYRVLNLLRTELP